MFKFKIYFILDEHFEIYKIKLVNELNSSKFYICTK